MSCLCKDGVYRSRCCPENQKNVYKQVNTYPIQKKYRDAAIIRNLFIDEQMTGPDLRRMDSLHKQGMSYPESWHPSDQYIGGRDKNWLIDGKPTRLRSKGLKASR